MALLDKETDEDWWEVEALLDLCFGPGRMALSSYRLRDGVSPLADLCFVLRDSEGFLKASIRYWAVLIGTKKTLLLGPVAVHPTYQGEGLGAFLISESLIKAKKLGWERALLVGDISYYGRFGFEKLNDILMPPPVNPQRVLGKALAFGAWHGVSGRVTCGFQSSDI